MTSTWDSRPELPPNAPPPAGPPATTGGDELLPRAPWPVWMGLAALPVAIVVASIAGLVVFGFAAAVGGEFDDAPPAANLTATLFQDAIFILTALVLARTVAFPRPQLFGLVRPRGWSTLGWSVLAYVSIAFAGAIIATIFGVGQEEQDEVLDSLGLDEGWGYVAAAAALVTIAAPLAEELLFRGFIFQAFRQRIGTIWGALASGALFGAIHITNYDGDNWQVVAASVLTLALLGTALALLTAKTGSLLPAIGLHAFNNSLAFGTMQDWDWQILPLALASVSICLGLAMYAIRAWPSETAQRAAIPG